MWFRAFACLCRYTSVVRRPFVLDVRFKNNRRQSSNVGVNSTGLSFEALISCSADPRRFLLHYFIHLLRFYLSAARVPYLIGQGCQRLLLRPSYYPFSRPSRHHISISIVTSPFWILRVMLVQQRACYNLCS